MKAKKVLAMLMASAMIMGMSTTVFAAGKPTETDSMNVVEHIRNVEPSATITAYQIIDAEYNANGFTGYKWVAGDKAGDDVTFTGTAVDGLNDEYITGLAADEGALEELTQKNAKDEPLTAGTWMLLVSGVTDGKVYNPMIISVYYTTEGSGSDNELATDGVNANDPWGLATNNVYVKSSEVTISKSVDDRDNTGELDQAAVDDTVEYTITSEIPSYSASSTAKFEITDEIKNGLTYVLPEGSNAITPVVKVGNQDVNTSNYTVTMGENGKSFTVEFHADYVKSLADANTDRTVTVTYQATVTSDAITDPAHNTATVTYDTGSKEADEYVYSVSFDGAAKKVDENGDGLAGATFTLYRDWTDKNGNASIDEGEAIVVDKTITDGEDEYDIQFNGLDADQTYYLAETAAPDGFSINENVYTITFSNVTETVPGSLTYDVLVDGEKVGHVNTYGEPVESSDYTIVNTRLHSLPSTGGIGTTIFTIGGCVVMVTAAGLYFASRKKNQEN